MASGSIRVSVVRGYVPSAYDAGAVDHQRGGDEKVPASIGGVGAEVGVGGEVVVEDLEVKVLPIRRDGELQPVGGDDFLVCRSAGTSGGGSVTRPPCTIRPYRSSGAVLAVTLPGHERVTGRAVPGGRVGVGGDHAGVTVGVLADQAQAEQAHPGLGRPR